MRTSLTMFPVLAAALTFGVAHAEVVDDEAMSGLNDHHRHHQHGGITQFVEMSLDTLGVDDKQLPLVDKVQSDLHTCMDPVEDNEQAVLMTLADGVAANKFDIAKVDASVAKLSASADTIHACVAGPLNELHKVLTPAQRAELGEKVRAHWAVWKNVNVTTAQDSRDSRGGITALAHELSLDDMQSDKIAAAIKASPLTGTPSKLNAQEVHDRVVAFAKAFAADSFDANAITSHSTQALTAHAAARMAAFYETVTPLLTPEQRTTLAAHLREHANHHSATSAAAGSQP